MEDDHHHHHHHNQYGMADLRQFMNTRPTSGGNLFTTISQPLTSELMNNQLEMLISGGHHQLNADHQIPTRSPFLHHPHQLFRSDSSTATAATSSGNNITMGASSGTLDMDFQSGSIGINGDGGSGRWPRQETLTLLEIRSRLDPKFKEANQKGPLWDEVSRIMNEDHGYQRSGKKCREKFENLYKYYKKTKEGKAGRQDGKHYRFFRQLEALYGESSGKNTSSTSLSGTPHLTGVGATAFPYTSQPPNQEMFHQAREQIIDDSVTPSNSAILTSSSDEQCSDLNATMALKKKGKRTWKAKIKHFIDGHMRNLLEKQEGWMEKMMRSIEHKEQERMMREEEWRKQETARIDTEQKFWAKKRAWIEARDVGLMEAFHNLTGIKLRPVSSSSPEADQELLSGKADHHHHQLQNQTHNGSETLMANRSEDWPECAVTRLIQLRTSMDSLFVQQNSTSEEEVLWEEIASNMACLGYENRSALMCKDKWESINNYLVKTKDQSREKRRENSTSLSSSCFYFQNNESICNNQRVAGEYHESNNLGAAGGIELTTSSAVTQRRPLDFNLASGAMQGNSFRFFMGDQASDNMWENYGLKMNKGNNNNNT